MNNQAALDLLSVVTTLILLVAVIGFLLWQTGPFWLILLDASSRAKTIEDWLAVLMIGCLLVWIGGDYFLFALLRVVANVKVAPDVAVYVHLVPHAVLMGVFVIRIIFMGYPRLVKQESRLWRARTSPVPFVLFAVAAVLDAGDYALRAADLGSYHWLPEPWSGFWALCGILAVCTWGLAGLAHWMSTPNARE